MVLRSVLFCLVFDHIFWYFIFIYAALTHRDEPQHHFHHDCNYHRWVYYVVLRKHGSIVCVISFFFYSIHYKVYIYLPCINTHRRTIAPFNITHILASSDCQTPRLYQGSDDCYGGNHNSDVICLIQPSLTIHYCNQSVLAIVPYLNIFVWSMKIFDLVSSSGLVQYFSIPC